MDVDLSLDEIIERQRKSTGKKFHTTNRGPNFNSISGGSSIGAGGHLNKQSKPQFKPATRVVGDARNKIIAKNRAKIIDARDVLVKSTHVAGFDARQRLMERKQQKAKIQMGMEPSSPPSPPLFKGSFRNRIVTIDNNQGYIQAFNDSTSSVKRKSVSRSGDVHVFGNVNLGGSGYKHSAASYMPPKMPAPRGYVDYDNMKDLEEEEYNRTLHYYRSDSNRTMNNHDDEITQRVIGNGKASPPPPPLPGMRRVNIWGKCDPSPNDPFDIYDSGQRNRIERPNLVDTDQLMHRPLYERRPLSGSSLSAELRARLHSGLPDRRISQGIYGNENNAKSLLMSKGTSSSSGSSGAYSGYRIVVSNLHNDVSTADIKELFSEIGPMYDARVVRPGTAEVIYKTLIDAERAVDTYHNRQLDGQPMTCMLVNPRSSNRPTAPAAGLQTAASKSNFQVDIDALHSVLFGDR